MPVQTFNVSLDKELLKRVDKAAKELYGSRSDYIRQALVEKLRADERADKRADLLYGELPPEMVDDKDPYGEAILRKRFARAREARNR